MPIYKGYLPVYLKGYEIFGTPPPYTSLSIPSSKQVVVLCDATKLGFLTSRLAYWPVDTIYLNALRRLYKLYDVSACVLLSLYYELRERDQMRGLLSI